MRVNQTRLDITGLALLNWPRNGADQPSAGFAELCEMTLDTAEPYERVTPGLDRSPLDLEGILSLPVWKELRTFLAVAKSKSFSAAAILLNASGPTVSRDVKRLEEQLGAQLVVSSHVGVKLTPTGHDLALHLAELDFRLFSISTSLRRERASLAGRVTISVTSGLSVAFIAPSVVRLNERYPELEISLKNQISIVDFHKNQADIMVSAVPIKRTGITMREIGVLHFIPVASRSYLQRVGVPAGRASIANHTFLQCGYYEAETPAWEQWKTLSEGGRLTHSSEDTLSYYSMVKCGAGIGLLGNYVLIEPSLVPIELGIHIPLQLYAVVETDRLRSKPVSAAYDWLIEVFETNPMFGNELAVRPSKSPAEQDFRSFFNLAEPSSN